MGSRRQEREFALQILYQIDVSGEQARNFQKTESLKVAELLLSELHCTDCHLPKP